jgi:hypothetical protein
MKKILFTVDDFEVRESSTYTIKDKPDLDAPSGYQKEGVTKLPSEGVGITFSAPYVTYEDGRGIWDTGFYQASPCYKYKDINEVKSTLKQVEAGVIKPYLAALGIDKEELAQTNDNFWDKQRFFVTRKKIYNTENPIEVMELYFALRSNTVAPKEHMHAPRYNNSSYVIIDTTKDLKLKEERSTKKFDATHLMMGLAKTNMPLLKAAMEYVGVRLPDQPTLEGIYTVFDEMIIPDLQRIDLFISALNKADTEIGSDELFIHSFLKTSSKGGKHISRAQSGMLMYKGTIIGPDLKSAAMNIAVSPELLEIKDEMILGE